MLSKSCDRQQNRSFSVPLQCSPGRPCRLQMKKISPRWSLPNCAKNTGQTAAKSGKAPIISQRRIEQLAQAPVQQWMQSRSTACFLTDSFQMTAFINGEQKGSSGLSFSLCCAHRMQCNVISQGPSSCMVSKDKFSLPVSTVSNKIYSISVLHWSHRSPAQEGGRSKASTELLIQA